MSDAALEAYLETIDPRWRDLVTDIHRTILAARPDLDSRISYRMLSYGLGGDLRNWVCAIDARPKGVSLRFLHGGDLRAAAGRLRRGSTTMGTIDYVDESSFDPAFVTALVQEATERQPEFKAAWAAAERERKAGRQ